VAESLAVAFVVVCVVVYAATGVFLYFALKKETIDKVGSISVKSFAGTFTDNVFQVVLRYSPREFREQVENPTSRRLHMWGYYSSRLLIIGAVALLVIRLV
jgi:hypothetical protein